MSWPAYLETHRSGELARRVEAAVAVLESCTVCPRDCRVNRLVDEAKVCRVGRRAKVASFFPHFGEDLAGHLRQRDGPVRTIRRGWSRSDRSATRI